MYIPVPGQNDETAARWASALKNDDGQAAKDLFPLISEGYHPFLEAILQDPLPLRVMTAALEAGRAGPGWMEAAVMGSNHTGHIHDWEKILAWHETMQGRQATIDSLAATLDQAGRTGVKRGSQAFVRGVLNYDVNQLDHILKNRWVGLAIRAAAKHPEDTWPERCSIGVDGLLERAHFAGALDALALTSLDETAPGTLLDQWLDHDPSRRAAWATAGQRDEERNQTLNAWMKQWLPEMVWHGSPLAQWCQNVRQGTPIAEDPMEDPAFGPGMAFGRISGDERNRLGERSFMACEGLKGYNLAVGLTAAINTMVYAWCYAMEANPEFFCHQHTAANRRHLALSQGDGAEWERATTPECGAWLRDTLRQGWRSRGLLERLSLADIVNWMIQDDAWRTWRSEDGASLLAVGLDVFAGYAATTDKKRLNQRMALKLDKLCPGLLTTPDAQGQMPLDQIDLTDVTRSAVLRQAIGREIKGKNSPAASGKPRM